MLENTFQDRLNISTGEIADFCRRWQIVELALFGSVLRDDFKPNSDVDVLVVFSPDANWSFLDHMRMELELEGLLDRKVDLVSKRAIEQSDNWLRRQNILDSAQPIYVSR